jgi:hypothetical protein
MIDRAQSARAIELNQLPFTTVPAFLDQPALVSESSPLVAP